MDAMLKDLEILSYECAVSIDQSRCQLNVRGLTADGARATFGYTGRKALDVLAWLLSKESK